MKISKTNIITAKGPIFCLTRRIVFADYLTAVTHAHCNNSYH